MNSKKGVIGGITMTIFSIIFIVIILLIYIFGAALFKKISGADGGVISDRDSEVGLGDMNNYMDGYEELVEQRVREYGETATCNLASINLKQHVGVDENGEKFIYKGYFYTI